MAKNIILFTFCHLVHFKLFFTSFTEEHAVLTKFQKMKLHHILGNKRSTFFYTASRFFITLFKMDQRLRIFIHILTSVIITFKLHFLKILFSIRVKLFV